MPARNLERSRGGNPRNHTARFFGAGETEASKFPVRRHHMSSGLAALTLFHVALSLIGILAGFVVVFALLSAKQSSGWTATFLITTAATSVTGFLFPFHKLLPSHILGIISLLVLAV